MLTRRQKQIRWTIGKLAAVALVSAMVMLPKEFEFPDIGNFNPLVTQAMASGG